MGIAASSSSSHHPLNSDLWLEIFKRLPVKSLCRFRCVCKSWNSLFTSTFFINLHGLSESPTNHKSYFLHKFDRRNASVFTLYNPHKRHSGEERVTNLGLPFPVKNIKRLQSFIVVDIVHGVACLAEGNAFVIWNPTTRKRVHIAGGKRRGGYENLRVNFGFGFSSLKSDFKVVAFLAAKLYYDYEVFSVRDGCWKRDSLRGDIYDGYSRPICNGCFVDGAIYWLVRSKRTRNLRDFCMLLFDCEREEFRTMELPQELSKIKRLKLIRLLKFGDKLSVLKRGESSHLPLELWVMEGVSNNNNNKTNTWSKLYSIDARFMSASLLNNHVLVGEYGDAFAVRCDELSSVELPFESSTLHQPLNSHVFRESLFLEDVKSSKSWPCYKGMQRKYEKERYSCLGLPSLCSDFVAKLMARVTSNDYYSLV